jgi:hypothetical protein
MLSLETTPLLPHHLTDDPAVSPPDLFFLPTGPAGPTNHPRGAERPTHNHSAGYIRMSFFDAGREEPVKGGYDGWNNPPRAVGHLRGLQQHGSPLQSCVWSRSPRTKVHQVSLQLAVAHVSCSYQQLTPPLSGKLDEESGSQIPVEMVTVPALGAEWG